MSQPWDCDKQGLPHQFLLPDERGISKCAMCGQLRLTRREQPVEFGLSAISANPDQWDRWRAAADKAGLSLSAWIREAADRAAEDRRDTDL